MTRADRIAAGDQPGRICLSRPTIPDTTGVAIDVPDMNSYPPDIAERTLTPGAAISGCIIIKKSHRNSICLKKKKKKLITTQTLRIAGETELGPLQEK